jgi:hypothetical protein
MSAPNVPPDDPNVAPTDAAAAQEAAPAQAADAPAALGEAAPEPREPQVYGESHVDRVTSLLLSFVVTCALAVCWLFVLYITDTRALGARPPAKIAIVEVLGGGGGTPEGKVGESETVNVPGGVAGQYASNNMEDASEFEEPAVEMTTSGVLDAFIEAPADVVDADIAEALPNAGPVASGRRMSKIGTGGPGFGFGGGPGDGGVPRPARWVIVFPAGQTPDEYARMLDYFGIEMGVPAGRSTIEYATNLSGTPRTRIGPARSDDRLFFSWEGGDRKANDVQMLARAGIQVGNKPIFHFYPKELADDTLAQLEARFAGRQPIEIRRTRFTVARAGNRWEFKVIEQIPLR